MSKIILSIDEVLENIKEHKITAEEGFSLIKELQQRSISSEDAPDESSTIYFKPVWEECDIATNSNIPSCILLFDTNEELWNKLIGGRSQVVLVKVGADYSKIADKKYEINPSQQEQYFKLIQSLSQDNLLPDGVIHNWSEERFISSEESINNQLETGIYSLLYLTKALLKQKTKNSIKLLYVYKNTGEAHPLCNGMAGFGKSICRESSKLLYKTVEIENQCQSNLDLLLNEFEIVGKDVEIRYRNNRRFVKRFKEIIRDNSNNVALREKGIYLITGGMGGLGFIFARYIARNVKCKLVLIGRSKLNSTNEQKIKELQILGAEVLYLRADVSKREDVKRIIEHTKLKFGHINAVIHAAGVIQDAFIMKKEKEEVQNVIGPKIYGITWLDEETKDENLDFFMSFSSIMSVLGNVGQCDYAYANGFLDSYSEFRESLKNKGKRKGKSLSINWPLWYEGGMCVDENTIVLMEKTLGINPMHTKRNSCF